jgi:WhiB family transcriptional regulator, redox-sensing transcriptional regulator
MDRVGSTPCMDCPEVFFPEDYTDRHTRSYAINVAKALCDTCPIKNECFTYAHETDQRYGIWAGTLPSER